MSSAPLEIRAYFISHPLEEIKPLELAKKLNLNHDAVRRALTRLDKENPREVMSAGKGRYCSVFCTKPGRKEAYRERKKLKELSPESKRAALRIQQESAFLREILFRTYGRICSCCGENNPTMLTLDHRNGDGATHRRQMHGRLFKVWKQAILENDPQKWRILCHNCNIATYRNGGTCPHQREANQ